jgi:RND superfamily putative drug exporter
VARWSAHHRWTVLGVTFLVLAAAVFASHSLEVQLQQGEGDIGESAEAFTILREKFPRGNEAIEQLLISHANLSVTDADYQAVAERLFDDLLALPQIKSVSSVYDSGAPGHVSADGHVLRTDVAIDRRVALGEHRADAILEAVADARDANSDAGYSIAIAGNLTTNREVSELIDEDFGQIMIVSLSLGLIILLLAFRALIAASIPLLLAVGAITIANGLAAVISQSYALNETYSEMILLLGLAVGIDYSLFIVSRYRKEREVGKDKYEAITAANNTTGRAVFFAGVTVLVSLAGLMLTTHPIFVSLALGAMLVVFVTIIGSLTFLPAFLAIIGDGVNRLRVPFLERVVGNGIWGTVTDKVMARPTVFASVTLIGLLALAVPAFALNIGFPTGSKALHNAVSTKTGLVLLETHFTAGFTDPALVLITAPDITTPAMQDAIANLIGRLEAEPERYFGPFKPTPNPAADTLLLRVRMSGDTEVAEIGIKALRHDVLPAVFGPTDGTASSRALVGGFAATNMDFREFIYGKAPIVFAFVLGCAFLLLLVMFRSIVIPIKSIILNMLSVMAAYGVLVMVFQWGWGISVLDSESSGVILAWLPLFLFAILFGLSMDYHMLLLNRVKESYDQTGKNDESVSMGIRLTAGQITSAAAIMVGVFSAFALAREVGLQQFGVGLGVSVLIDATIIRSILLPATMKLLGDWNWYLPSWLEWLPRVSLAEPEPESA